jgi:hypothetical protein
MANLKQILRQRVNQEFTEATTLEHVGIDSHVDRYRLFIGVAKRLGVAVPADYHKRTDLRFSDLVDIIVGSNASNKRVT